MDAQISGDRRAVASLEARQAYLDGELCGVGPDGITSFARIQAASDAGNGAGLVFFLFDLLHLDGDDLAARPLTLRKRRLAALLPADGSPLHYSDHVIGQGPAFYDKACAMHVEGIVSKSIDAPYMPGNCGLWRKVKCLNRPPLAIVSKRKRPPNRGASCQQCSAVNASALLRERIRHSRPLDVVLRLTPMA